ncbi:MULTISPECIES: DUF6969 family protein [Alphaproteobacteria]|uniref:DUF6969 domain-containing protein n=2 Tax=Alphaproteobacteria TaxID=28211 RepID=A0A934TIC0_9RHOB|nr:MULTISPECIES: hypothetical protein [Alphaproteobacteria]MBK1697183.1 hypothetical protein [Rhodovibrio salinarum]MBK5925767.1 hypothetical protein [Rhodobaculum claviforme]
MNVQAETKAASEGGFATVDLSQVGDAEVAALGAAARRVREIETDLAVRGGNVVARLLAEAEAFYEWDHYPEGDAYDPSRESQYFYHAHAAEERFPGEHGHFHTFVRPVGLSDLLPGDEMPPPTALTHLVAVSIDTSGRAVRLFTTNRWVTGERWYPAATAVRLLANFEMTGDKPAPEVNGWLSALLRLYRADIAALLTARDAALVQAGGGVVSEAALENRELEVTSQLEIDVAARIQIVEAEATRRGV